ncbi:uncharacterized protein LOC118756833 [Rhagoletis pomonella]|uniref:uncharacterized protein LOC118756833 n=1 Tax=Rhagoletis pomonella TaxID=28610 RepID=UPI00177FA3DB|nr:uncharacterized protein LOC118756833 [Rhagoletis pomonella]
MLPGSSSFAQSNATLTINQLPTAIEQTSPDVTAWNLVRNKKLSKSKDVVVGRNVLSTELEVAVKKWLHISSFKPHISSVTADDVISYVAKHFGIENKYISCFILVKKGISVTDLDSVNFKLGVSSSFYNTLLDANLWPLGINVRPFRFFQKDVQ